MKRLSSTPLGTFLRCPRKLWYEFGEEPPHPVQSNEPMSFGTIFHALAEFYQNKGRLPSDREFAQLKGNYDDPIEAKNRYPHLYQPALDTMFWLLDEHPEMFEFPDDAVAEQDTEEWGLYFNNGTGTTVAGGYIDILVPSQQKISDWKTRGGFGYCPRTPEQFFADPQLCYYAALAAYHYGWDTVTVEHRNILRPDSGGPELMVCSVDLPAYYLKGVWQLLDTKTVTAMREVLEQTDERNVERNTGGCYSKGKCTHIGYCGQSYDEEHNDPLSQLHAAIGVEAAPDPLELLQQGMTDD